MKELIPKIVKASIDFKNSPKEGNTAEAVSKFAQSLRNFESAFFNGKKEEPILTKISFLLEEMEFQRIEIVLLLPFCNTFSFSLFLMTLSPPFFDFLLSNYSFCCVQVEEFGAKTFDTSQPIANGGFGSSRGDEREAGRVAEEAGGVSVGV